jgi:hypothetical protein
MRRLFECLHFLINKPGGHFSTSLCSREHEGHFLPVAQQWHARCIQMAPIFEIIDPFPYLIVHLTPEKPGIEVIRVGSELGRQ